MGKDKKYRIARGFNLVNLILASIFLIVTVLLLLFSKNIAYGKYLWTMVLPIAVLVIIMPIITHVSLSNVIKTKVDESHNWLAIFTIFLSIPFGLISGIFILIGDVEKAPVVIAEPEE